MIRSHSTIRARKFFVLLRAVTICFHVSISLFHWLSLSLLYRLRLINQNRDVKGRVITSLFERLGPTFIKTGQIMSSRPDIFGQRFASTLSKLQYRVKPVPVRRILEVIKSSYSKPYYEVFEYFRMESIACGSIAQVYYAVLITGQPVAVKVQRPGLRRVIEFDFSLFSGFGKMIERFKRFHHLPICDLIHELNNSIKAQLDFRLEVENLNTIKANLNAAAGVFIPGTYPHLCNDFVIVMDHVDPSSVCKVEELSHEERVNLALYGLRILYKMIFVDGLVHADLHRGNIFFRHKELAIVDFGLIARLDRRSRRQFRDLFFAMCTNNGKLCAKVILETAKYIPADLDSKNFTVDVTQRLNLFFNKNVYDFEVVRFVNMIFDVQHQFRIRSSTDFTIAIISLLLYEGILKELAPDINFQQEAIEMLLNSDSDSLTRDERIGIYNDLKTNVAEPAW